MLAWLSEIGAGKCRKVPEGEPDDCNKGGRLNQGLNLSYKTLGLEEADARKEGRVASGPNLTARDVNMRRNQDNNRRKSIADAPSQSKDGRKERLH